MDLKKLCLDLAYSESEDKIISHLNSVDLWDNSNAWVCFGNNENNFGTIGNQQSRPETALVEKIINSVDAMLISECLSRKIDPEGENAPNSLQKALVDFYGIYEGKLSNISAIERTDLATNICLVATGKKSKPCYSIIDKGEGQTPQKMPDTLLSIGRSNKLRIPFVQGKFNMGGTGVFQFCGDQNLQLIITKRNPNIAMNENDETKHKWGFTIIRRFDPHGGIRNSIYKYLAPNNQILSFESNGLPILPGDYPIAYKENLEWGTFIKLYEYQIGPGLRTNIVFDLYNRLSLLMPTIALPTRLYERRAGYGGHSPETTLSGLSVRLEEDRRENLEDNFPTSFEFTANGQDMKGQIFAFKKGQSEKYMKEEGIIFSINGQTHGFLSKAFFSRQSVGMGYIANSILLIIDCSNISGRSKEDLFMNSRDRLRSGNLRAEIEDNLTEIIKNHPGLKSLRERRRREAIEDKLKDSKPLAEIVENLLKKSPTLSKLFITGSRISDPFNLTGSTQEEEFIGKKFPTFFKLKKEFPESNPKLCPINQKFRIQYITDAVNDYFNRDSDPGNFSLKINGDKIDKHIHIWNGAGTLIAKLPSGIAVGDQLEFTSHVMDPQRIEPFEEKFIVRVEPKQDHQKTSTLPTQRKPSSNKNGDDGERKSNLDLPHIIEIRKDDWDEHSFSEKSALKVVATGESGYDFIVNMDNVFLLSEIKFQKNIDERLLFARYKFALVLIGLALLKMDSEKSEEETENGSPDIFSEIESVTSAISPILLPMISSLGELEIEDEE